MKIIISNIRLLKKKVVAEVECPKFKAIFYLLFAVLVMGFNVVNGQIVVDNTAAGSAKETKNLTVNHTVSPGLSNSVMVVSLLITGPLDNVKDLTYGGIDLTFVKSSTRSSVTIAVYTLINPPVGSNALSIKSSSKRDITLAATSFGNVNQDNIFSSIQNENGNDKDVEKTMDCDEGSFAMDFLSLEDKTGKMDAGQTLVFDKRNANGEDYFYSSYKIASSGTDNLKWKFKDTNYNFIWGCLNPAPPFVPMLDFDGIDNYLSRASVINGFNNVTLMAWVKSDAGNTTDMVIAGEDSGCKLWLQNGKKPMFTIKSAGNAEKSVSCADINLNEWHHITGSYTSATGTMKLYVDGKLANTANVGNSRAVIQNTILSLGTFEIGRLSSNVPNKQYFKGDLDEIRVFNSALTDSQLRQIIYQEIENNEGKVRGKIIPKDVSDIDTKAVLSWSNLKLYYRMGTDFTLDNKVQDYSGNANHASIFNVSTWQEETAPLPYVTKADGNWTSTATWLYGDVWDIEDIANNKDWSIIKISNDVSACHTVKTIGLIVDAGTAFKVHTDNLLENSWYLELNGTIDLEGDAQLIQTITSDLVTSSTGKILRHQEGTSNAYRYNYWSSPVGITAATSLIDNNLATNNPNNSAYNLNMLKDESGFNMQFTTAYNQVGKISTYWLYTFKNGVTYWDWASLSPTAPFTPGIGYTQKGTGNAGMEQQYIFEGKPNNGTILLNVTDKGGAGSVPNVSKTEYLLGNPYPSALDIHKFIDDNAGVIGGSLQLWQQWGGNSHFLSEYEGGYAQVNKTGSVRAYQFVGFYGATNGSKDGTVTPSRYLPVGQGFLAEIVEDGTVEFNNSQRVFIKESDADGTYNNGASFFKSSNVKSKNNQSAQMQRIRLEFSSVSGPKTRREMLLGFSENTSDGFDYGYDAECTESNNNDFNLNLEGKNMNIQAYSPINDDKVIPLNFKSSGSNSFEIKISELEDIEDGQKIYLKDNLTGGYFELTTMNAYRFSSKAGKFNKRFEMVFQSESKTLKAVESKYTENFIYYQNSSNTLFAKKLSTSVSKLALINMNGQTVLELRNLSLESLNNGLKISNVATGAYVVCFRTNDNQVFSKKLIVN